MSFPLTTCPPDTPNNTRVQLSHQTSTKMWKRTLFLALSVCLMMSLQADALLSKYAEEKEDDDLTMFLFLMMFMNQNQNQQQPIPQIIYAPMPSYDHKGGYGGGMFGGMGYGSSY
ncbi:hypothetical protein ScPMuIL_004079 [Solemya velum]